MLRICKRIILKSKHTLGSLIEQVLCVPYKSNCFPLLDLSLEIHPHRVAPNLAVSPPPASSFGPDSTGTPSFSHPGGGERWKSLALDQSLDPDTTCFGLTPISGCSLSVSLHCPNNQYSKYFSLETLSIVGKGKRKEIRHILILLTTSFFISYSLTASYHATLIYFVNYV